MAAARSTPAFTTTLDSYIARDEAAYKWEKISQKKIGKNDVTTLLVTSQTWQGIEWKHRVEIATPEKIEFPGWALLYLSTTNGVFESILTQSLASKMGAVTIHVTGIPNQPLFGKREDALIAHTFFEFMRTGDKTWPLLLPMTKSATKVMDAVQEYSSQQEKPLEKFVVMGASKRGWAAWLVAAADTKKRVAGIVPLVYDNLNSEKQLAHQLESWGEYSPLIADYTRDGFQEKMRTARGQELSKIIDPYHYRSRLMMPKLIINATNDEIWTLDSLNLYWKDLPGPKNVYYAPNVGHTMEGDLENVFGTATAWFRLVAGGRELPKVELSSPLGIQNIIGASPKARVFIIDVKSKDKIKSGRLWIAHSATADFRKAQWKPSKDWTKIMPEVRKRLKMPESKKPEIPLSSFATAFEPQANYQAYFIEYVFGEGFNTLRLSSPLVIWDTSKDKISQSHTSSLK